MSNWLEEIEARVAEQRSATEAYYDPYEAGTRQRPYPQWVLDCERLLAVARAAGEWKAAYGAWRESDAMSIESFPTIRAFIAHLAAADRRLATTEDCLEAALDAKGEDTCD